MLELDLQTGWTLETTFPAAFKTVLLKETLPDLLSGQSTVAAQTVSLIAFCGNAHFPMIATQTFFARRCASEMGMCLSLDASHEVAVPLVGVHAGPVFWVKTGVATTAPAAKLNKATKYIIVDTEAFKMV